MTDEDRQELELLREIMDNVNGDGTSTLSESRCLGCGEHVGIGGYAHDECCPFIRWQGNFRTC